MTTVTSSSSLTSSSTSTSSTTTSSDTTTSVDFLTLLVTELQNQNPLDPTDTTEFTGQMMSYASYSQMVEMNSTLTSLQESVDGYLSSLSSSS